MQVQLFVERDQNECIVNLAGTAYKFKRNEHGHLVSEITDQEHIKWVTDPNHNTAFKAYSAPEKKISEEGVAEEGIISETVESRMSAHFGNEMTGTKLPPYPQKGSKRPARSKG